MVYIQVSKEQEFAGNIYKAGSVFELCEETPQCIIKAPGHSIGFLIDKKDFHKLTFTPSPLFNHAVELGFNADPRFLQSGTLAGLERMFLYVGGFPHTMDLDTATNTYIEYDDMAKKAKDKATQEHYAELASKYNWIVRIIEGLKLNIEKYNKVKTLENYAMILSA